MNCLTSHLLPAVTLFCAPAFLQAQGAPIIENSFAPALPAGSVITELAVTGDGKVLVAGSFTDVDGLPRTGLARFEPDGALDENFDPGTGPDAPVSAILPAGEGSCFVAGRFATFNGEIAGGVARLLADGSVDPVFEVGDGTSGRVTSLARSGQTVIAGGSFARLGGTPATYVGALGQGGAPLPGFAAGLEQSMALEAGVDCLAVQTDGKILVGGNFVVGGSPANLARLHPDGSVDAGFDGDPGPALYPTRIVVGANGLIYVAGLATADNDGFVRRLLPNGDVDESFVAPALNGMVYDILVQENGRVIVAGKLADQPGTAAFRLLPDGSLDPEWQVTADGLVLTLAPAAEGKIFAGGTFSKIQGTDRTGLALLSDSGPAFHGASATGGGAFRVFLEAVPGATYTVEASEDMQTWTTFATNTASGAGLEIVDPKRSGHRARFFRARLATK